MIRAILYAALLAVSLHAQGGGFSWGQGAVAAGGGEGLSTEQLSKINQVPNNTADIAQTSVTANTNKNNIISTGSYANDTLKLIKADSSEIAVTINTSRFIPKPSGQTSSSILQVDATGDNAEWASPNFVGKESGKSLIDNTLIPKIHEHSNKIILDKFGETVDHNLTYNGNTLETIVAQRDVYNGLDSSSTTVSLAAMQGKVLRDKQLKLLSFTQTGIAATFQDDTQIQTIQTMTNKDEIVAGENEDVRAVSPKVLKEAIVSLLPKGQMRRTVATESELRAVPAVDFMIAKWGQSTYIFNKGKAPISGDVPDNAATGAWEPVVTSLNGWPRFSVYNNQGGSVDDYGTYSPRVAEYDNKNGWNFSTDEYTIPVAGLWTFKFFGYALHAADSRVGFRKNGTFVAQKNLLNKDPNFAVDIYCEVGDKIAVSDVTNHSIKYYGTRGYNAMQGHLAQLP